MPAQDVSRETRAVDDRRIAAWIGKAVAVKGDVTCSQDLTIDGRVDGTITLGDHNLVIGAGAAVRANLAGRIVTISGAVTGDVKASEKVELHATGSVNGDIVAPRIAMAEGAVLQGRVDAMGSLAGSSRSQVPSP